MKDKLRTLAGYIVFVLFLIALCLLYVLLDIDRPVNEFEAWEGPNR